MLQGYVQTFDETADFARDLLEKHDLKQRLAPGF